MFMDGKVYSEVEVDLDTEVTVASLRIKDANGDTVILVNSEAFTDSDIEETSPYQVPAGSLIQTGQTFGLVP